MTTATKPLWTFADLLAASGGTLDGVAPSIISGVSIDTRSLEPGDLFVPLTDARDGHEFVSQAFAKGAAAALVRHAYLRKPGDGALIRVDDPLKALERIGVAARNRLAPAARVIALTGSAGKTGTKEMLRACLSPLGRTHAPEKSYNNHWGVPLTLARMPAETQFAVFEIGMNHAGEITPLTRMVRPDIAIITNVLSVHVGHFPDGEIGIANAKAEIFDGLASGGIAILPRDNPHFDRLQQAADARAAKIVSFGTDQRATLRATAIALAAQQSDITIAIDKIEKRFTLGAPGLHLATNALAVAAVIDLLGRDLETALVPLAAIRAPAGRGARTTIELAGGPLLLIDESYNANPASMRAALATLATVPRETFPRRIAVLGDMRELGAGAIALHQSLAEPLAQSAADLVFACGEHMQHLYALIPEERRGAWRLASKDLVADIAPKLRPGDVVMIKGSLGTNMAPIVKAIRDLAPASG